MDEIKSFPTDHEEDQQLKPSATSASSIEEKPTDGEKAKEILKDVEKLVEHEPSIISADVIQNMRKIQAELILKEVEEPKNLQKVPAKLILKDLAKLILKDLEGFAEREPSVISADVIKKLENIRSQLKEILRKYEEKKAPPHQRLHLEEDKLDPILKNFKVSYDNLNYQSRNDNLNYQSRICLLYLSIFPEDAVIKKRPIIYWWIANGLVKPNDEKKKTAEEVGEDVFEELLQSHLIMADEKKKTAEEVGEDVFQELLQSHLIMADEKKKKAEEVGEDVFQELLQSHLIMPCDEDEISIVKKCRIHPWIRHMLITFARKANLFDFDPEGMLGYGNASSGHVCFQKDGDSKKVTASTKPEDQQSSKGKPEYHQSSKGKSENSSHVDSQEDGNSEKPMEPQQTLGEKTANSGHVGSQEDGDWQKPVDSKKSVKNQQSSEGKTPDSGRNYFKTLFNVGDKYLSLNPTWFATHKKLVALQLGRWQASPRHHIEVERDDLLLKALGNQKLLKYLSLRGISRITELPASILGLTNLEILDLKACHNLETLPEDISVLSKLTHLDVSDCYLLDGMPKGLGKLSSLQVLKGFIIAESKKIPTRIGNLKSLENLKRFSIRIGSEAEILHGEFEELEHLKSVQRLKISWGVVSGSKKREQVMKEDFKLPTSLEKLTLEGLPHEKFPDWLKPSKLKKLKMLYIEGGNLSDLGHGESDQEWKVEILHLWYMIKSPGIDSPKAKQWFPYLRCRPQIKYREVKEDAQSEEAKKHSKN